MNSMIPAEYQSIVVEITTPYATGTGFCLKEQGIVVTNEHIVRDNRNVVIDHPAFGKQLATVIFLDSKKDLALLQMSKNLPTSIIKLPSSDGATVGQKIWALGGKRKGEILFEKGSINGTSHLIDGVPHLLHDAVLSIRDSGGPLFDSQGVLLGINTFMRRGGQIKGLALPVRFIKDALASVQLGNGRTSCCCFQCGTTIFDDSPLKNICPNCGESIELPSLIPAYQPIGIAATIEKLLSKTVSQIELTRRGPNSWQIQQGSAEINISYYEKNGLIVGDAHLCELPSSENKALYAFLLRQNFEIENLTFSIREQDIVLSLMIYDRYLNEETGHSLFKHLFEQADAYDNILVEQYGASWKTVS